MTGNRKIRGMRSMTDLMLYIDPGTGSMLFSIIIGITGVIIFTGRALWIRFKFLITGGRSKDKAADTIPICIFSEGKRYHAVFRPICDEFERRQKDITYLTADPDDPALDLDYKYVHTKFIGEGNRAISKMNLINACVVLSTTPGLDVYQWKRSKGAKWYVHIPHMPGDVTRYRMFGLDFYDAVMFSGKYQEAQIRKLEDLRGLPAKEAVYVGIPYMDSMLERLRALPQNSEKKKDPVILLAPSWGKSGILSIYGSAFIDSLIKTGYRIVIRPHPQSFFSEKELIDELMNKYPESDMLKWNKDPDNFDVLNEADILISDFSGVLFDFSLVFNKPVIYTEPHYDKSPYDCFWDDEELWTFKVLPKIGRQLNKDNFSSIASLVNECLTGSDAGKLARERDKAREETWCFMGEGASKAADYLIVKQKELSESL